MIIAITVHSYCFMIHAEIFKKFIQCSIDSLLERTIKHMLFLQSIAKHADKLSKCAESKVKSSGIYFENGFLKLFLEIVSKTSFLV